MIIHADPKIEQLLKLNISVNRKEQLFQGYRIQILSRSSYGTNVDTLKSYTKRFEEEFPDIPAYLQYTDPDFKNPSRELPYSHRGNPCSKTNPQKVFRRLPGKTTIYLHELNPVVEQDTVNAPRQFLYRNLQEYHISIPPFCLVLTSTLYFVVISSLCLRSYKWTI